MVQMHTVRSNLAPLTARRRLTGINPPVAVSRLSLHHLVYQWHQSRFGYMRDCVPIYRYPQPRAGMLLLGSDGNCQNDTVEAQQRDLLLDAFLIARPQVVRGAKKGTLRTRNARPRRQINCLPKSLKRVRTNYRVNETANQR